MLRITVREEEKKGRIQAAVKVAGPWVAELENAWRADLARATGQMEALYSK
jgi:phage FluMu gp28-like protein